MFELKFWKAAGERVVGAFSGGVLGALGMGVIDVFSVPWQHAFGVGAGAAVLSLLGSLAKSGVGPEGPGLTETVTPRPDGDLDQALRQS